MTDTNMKIWESLCGTDPKHTKSFTRSGGFKGTAVAPIYSIKRMTELFGPCGMGWGYDCPQFTIHDAGEHGVLVYATIALWYLMDNQKCITYGVGGDLVVAVTKNGPKADDEAFKKATTDALTNAMKSIGVAADVHMGLFDDSKYVNDMIKRFDKVFPIAARRNEFVKKVMDEINGARSVEGLKSVWQENGVTLKRMQDSDDEYDKLAYGELEKAKDSFKGALVAQAESDKHLKSIAQEG